MKKALWISTIAATSLMAGYAQHAYVYNDARIMAMGGANVAVGGYSTSVFSNPAGLLGIKKEHGFEVELLGLQATYSSGAADFAQDLSDAADTEDDAEIAKVIQKYSGDYFHIDASNYSSLSKNGDFLAWSVGLLAASDVNLIPHANDATKLLEVHGRVYGGLVLSGAKAFDGVGPGTLDAGITVKYIAQKSYDAALSTSEILDNSDDLGSYLQDTYGVDNSAIGLDLGVNYHPFPDNALHPSFGLSVLNVGGLDMGDNYGSVPMTVNLGVGIAPEVALIEDLKVAVDYCDILNAQKGYLYERTLASNAYVRTELDDTDFMKRLRMGVSATLIDTGWVMTNVSLGMYQGAYTAGIDMQLAIVKLTAATYEEQVGLTAGDWTDRRYTLALGIGW